MTRVLCRVDRKDDTVVVRGPGGEQRTLQLVDAAGRKVPWDDAMVARGIAGVPANELGRHLTGRAGVDDLVAIGRWLHDVLLGDAELDSEDDGDDGRNDDDNDGDDGGDDGGPIELTIALGDGAEALDWLPWETLHDGRGPLALRRRPKIAIARAVGRGAGPGAEPGDGGPVTRELGHRMLVVIAGELTDPTLLPAAEYLGLLETLHRSGSGLMPIPLVDPTLDDVAGAVAAHAPDLVHVLARGEEHAEGGGALLFRGVPAAGRSGAPPDRVGVDRLLAALTRPDGSSPSVLVLTAADPGIVGGFGYQPSLAAACARGGIPLVVGMSGPVASRSCRNFAVGFYSALVHDEPVAVATAAGRRSILLGMGDAVDAAPEVEWSYPTVWLSVDASTRFRIPGGAGLAQRVAAANALRSQFKDPRPFCSREAVLDAALQTVHLQRHESVLALHRNVVGERVGATRTLAELAGRLVLGGHLPLLVTTDPGNDIGMQPDDFVRAALRALKLVVDELQLDLPDLTSALAPLDRDGGLPERLRSDLLLDPAARTDGRGRLWALRAALAGWQDELLGRRTAGEPGATARSFVLLVDDLDRRGPVVEPFLRSLGNHGFGRAEQRIPVIFTYGEGRGTAPHDPVRDAVANATYILRVELDRLQPTDGLYRQLLVGRPEPLMPRPEWWAMVLEELDDITDRGIAGHLAGPVMDRAIRMLTRFGHLDCALQHEQLAVLNRGPA